MAPRTGSAREFRTYPDGMQVCEAVCKSRGAIAAYWGQTPEQPQYYSDLPGSDPAMRLFFLTALRHLDLHQRHVLLATVDIAVGDVAGSDRAANRDLERHGRIVRAAHQHIVGAHAIDP